MFLLKGIHPMRNLFENHKLFGYQILLTFVMK
jgi:hypothetical protein